MPTYNPNFPQGVPQQVNWAAALQPQRGAQAVPNAPVMSPPPVDSAPAAASEGLDPDLVSAVLALQGQSPRQAALQRQLKMADKLRSRGADLNTGSVGGAAPNWAGALANMAADWRAGKLDKEAAASGDALAGEQTAAARRYFDALRRDR